MSRPTICTTTMPDMESAKKMARELVEGSFAACVQLLPVNSVYKWKGKIEDENEILLICKIPSYHHESLEKAILERHPYELPQILFFNAAGAYAPYFEWMENCITNKET
ncbi:MAG: divalent-cation tolerance protein CutA [Fibromonadales bacterium]|nr:divalent-cation tolerance protein CutA [Fibromonadales bacterium]